MRKRIVAIAAMLLLLSTVSGCARFSNIDELYSLPKPQTEFLQLQKMIDEEIAAGSEYSAPTAGSQRQSIQLVDINGDGVEEALAFLRDNHLAPKICVYQNIGGEYQLVSTITGEGTAVGRVEYADLDGDGIQEIIVSWTMSTDLMLANAYSLKDWSTSVLLSKNCTDFLIGDINGNGSQDVVLLNFEDAGGSVTAFTTDLAGEITEMSAKVSSSLESADRFRISSISGGVPAVFVEGHYDNKENAGSTYLTDVFAVSDSKLKNLTMNSETMNSYAAREYDVYAYDINGDGALEVPFAERVFLQPKVSTQYYIFDWYSYDVSGNHSLVTMTYHCYGDGWYFEIPDEMRNGFTVRREAAPLGERTVVISSYNEISGAVTDLITIYTLSDENRADRATLEGRFVLLSNETTIYAAKFNDKDPDTVTDEQKQNIIERFHLIYSEWNIGAV